MFLRKNILQDSDIKNQLLGLKTGGTAIYKNTGLVVCEIKPVGWCVEVAKTTRQNRSIFIQSN